MQDVPWSTIVPIGGLRQRRAALALAAAALPFAYFDIPAAACAEHIMRTPNVNIAARIPNRQLRTMTSRDQSEHRLTTASASRRVGQQPDAASCALSPNLSGLQLRPSRQRRRMLGQAGAIGRWRRRRVGGHGQERQEQRSGRQASQAALNPRTVPNELVAEIDGSLSDAQADATGAASRPGAAAIAEFSADRRHHRPVPHHRSPPCRDGAPRIRRRGRRSLGAVQFPLFAAGPEGGIEPRAIPRNMRWRNFGCRRRIRWRTAPTSPSP